MATKLAEKDTGTATAATQFVTFICGKETFAVELTLVQEIIRLPAIVRVPLSPPALEGLINLRGTIIPVVSLQNLFNLESTGQEDNRRIIVLNLAQPVGCIVDQVTSVVSVDSSKIESIEGITANIDKKFLKGVIKDTAGFSVIMMLSVESLIDSEFSQLTEHTKSEGLEARKTTTTRDEEKARTVNERQLVSFTVAGQEYAVDIQFAKEIVQIPESVVKIPNTPSYLLGIINLRSQLLPLIDLKTLFSLQDRTTPSQGRILVITYKNYTIGLVTDMVSEVLRVPVSLMDPMPMVFSQANNLMDISQICRLDGGKKLVAVVSLEQLFAQYAIQDSIEKAESMTQQSEEETTGKTTSEVEEQFVVYHLADGEFGVPIASVQEIVRLPDELTRIPKAPDYVEGVINLRGSILPVIDHRKRLGLAQGDKNDKQRIIVFAIKGIKTGFIVDSVSEVIKIPVSAIVEAPRVSREQMQLLDRVANLEQQKRVIQLLNPDYLFEDLDTEQLAKLDSQSIQE
jgi:purine-binding chemotaxis protein CheW